MSAADWTSIWGSAKDICGVVGVVGSFLAAFGVLWLSKRFITREEFEDYRKEQTALLSRITETLGSIDKTLAVMQEAAKTQQKFETRIDDHERRIRELEISVGH